MLSVKEFPAPLKEKFISLIVLSVIFWIVGICVALLFSDITMFILSVLVCICCIIKAYMFYKTVSDEEYEVLEGSCISVSPILIRKQKKIKIKDNEGNERSLILSKHSKVSIGTEYKFYFKETKKISLGSEYFDSILSSDCFLGYEECLKEQ